MPDGFRSPAYICDYACQEWRQSVQDKGTSGLQSPYNDGVHHYPESVRSDIEVLDLWQESSDRGNYQDCCKETPEVFSRQGF